MASGGTPVQQKSGRTDSLTFQTQHISTIPQSLHSPPDGHADIAAHLGVPIAGGRNEATSGIPTTGQFRTLPSHQTAIPDAVSNNSDQFDDAPYVPPRVAPTHPALNPRFSNPYPPSHNIQRNYPYDGASPSGSHHSAGSSNWSTPSSSTSNQHLPHEYLLEPASQYHQEQLQPRHTTYPPYYPAYHGQQRVGLEHVRHGAYPSNIGGSYYPQDSLLDGSTNTLLPALFDDATVRVALPSHHATSSYASSSSSSMHATNQPTHISTFPASSSPLSDNGRSLFPDAGPYLRQQLGLSPRDSVGLHSIPDPPPGEKPSTSLPMLIKLAIYGSEKKQLTLQEIYTALENRFQWFRDNKHSRAWKNSIRHNLSLNQVFKNVPRPVTEPGKGSYWQLDVSKGEGYKRARKRRPKSKVIASEEDDDEASEEDEDRASPLDTSQQAGPSRSSATPIEDVCIDPELRNEGHLVGEARTRSMTRRAAGSPYPSQSPRYQQGTLPVVAGPDASQNPVRFGQPSFGQSSFPIHPPARSMPTTTSSNLSFATMSSSSMLMGPNVASTFPRPLQHAASYDRTMPVPQPLPRPGVEYVMDAGGLSAARRVESYLEPQEPSQGGATHSRSESSSSGSSRTWNEARSMSRMDDDE